jgi:hypothetical protein
MPALSHSPADVLRSLLIQLGHGNAMPSTDWPIALVKEPNSPDNAITLTDTAGRRLGRSMTDGRVAEYQGVQVRVRASDHQTGWQKVKAIEVSLDEDVLDEWVSLGSSAYLVHCVMRPGSSLVNGKETLKTDRSIFTLNVLLDLKQAA